MAGIRPGQSAGKKDLPAGVRARFTEFFVDEVHTAGDVARVVRSYLERDIPNPPVDAIVGFQGCQRYALSIIRIRFDTLFLECLFVLFCAVFSCSAILRIEGWLNSALQPYSWHPIGFYKRATALCCQFALLDGAQGEPLV